jgi:hypothetical protein
MTIPSVVSKVRTGFARNAFIDCLNALALFIS